MKRLIYLPLAMLLTLLASSCESYIERQDEMTTGKPDNSYYISIDEAEATLNNMLRDAGGAITKSAYSISSRYAMPIAAQTKSGQEPSNIYVFNFGDNEGFAIMSGDKRVEPLLALAEAGSLAPGEPVKNNGMQIYLACLERYYRSKTAANDTIDGEYDGDIIAGNWDFEYQEMVYGTCQVKWGQLSPYNDYCPEYEGENMPAGCGAVAVAQLMSIFRYPSEYNGYKFDWDEMLKVRNINDTEESDDYEEPKKDSTTLGGGLGGITIIPTPQDTSLNAAKRQIARLMQQIGLDENMNMIYDPTGSCSTIEHAPRTFKNFGYAIGGIYHPSPLPINASNKNIVLEDVIEELKLGFPCLVRGTLLVDSEYHTSIFEVPDRDSTINTLGHIWIIHGLLTLTPKIGIIHHSNNNNTSLKKYYLLCNFGEDGLYDGYYLSDVINIYNGPTFTETKSTEITDFVEPGEYFQIAAVTCIRPELMIYE